MVIIQRDNDVLNTVLHETAAILTAKAPAVMLMYSLPAQDKHAIISGLVNPNDALTILQISNQILALCDAGDEYHAKGDGKPND